MNPFLCTPILIEMLFELDALTSPRSLPSTSGLTFIAQDEELGDIGCFSFLLDDLNAYRAADDAVNERESRDRTRLKPLLTPSISQESSAKLNKTLRLAFRR